MKNFNNLVEASNHYIQKGYTDNLHLENERIFCKEKNIAMREGEFVIEAVYRFEENTDPSDNSVMYVIASVDGQVKGLLIDAYGVYQSEGNNPILQHAEAQTLPHQSDEDPSLKYGVRKVVKADFNQNPSRYELRKGFPDFPSCPWGNKFSMLGYDKEKKEYVWLVSSIIRDERLKTSVY